MNRKNAVVMFALLMAPVVSGCGVAHAPGPGDLGHPPAPKVPEDKRKDFGKELMPDDSGPIDPPSTPKK